MNTTKKAMLLLLILAGLTILGCAAPHGIGAANKRVGCGYHTGMSGY